jgi:ankyrin repeat protein
MQENPIHYAARHGKLDALRIIIQSNLFQIDEKNTDGETPLCIACDVGYVEIARELIVNKAQINCENDKFKTPLILATELVSPYDMDMVKLLLANGSLVNQITQNKNTALLSAAKYGNLELVKYLVEIYKAKINHKFHDGATPLMRACYYGYLHVVKYLLSKGALLEERNNRNENPLYIASFRGYEDIVKILIEHGANVNSEDNDGDTPLTVACYENKAIIIPLLLDNHAIVNQKVRKTKHF